MLDARDYGVFKDIGGQAMVHQTLAIVMDASDEADLWPLGVGIGEPL